MKLNQLKWKQHLNTEELIDFVMKISPIDEDEESIAEYFEGATADLKEVDLSWIKRKEGMELRDDPHVYSKLSASTAPPILVNNDGTIEDGQHRYESAVKRADKKILAYVLKYSRSLH